MQSAGWCIPGFLKIVSVQKSVCMHVCVSAPEVINNHDMDSYDWFNKATAFIQQLKSLLVVGVPLELKCFIETTLVRVNYHCINCTFILINNCAQAARRSGSVIKVGVVGMAKTFPPSIFCCIYIYGKDRWKNQPGLMLFELIHTSYDFYAPDVTVALLTVMVFITSLPLNTWLPSNTLIITKYIIPGSSPLTVRGLLPLLVTIGLLQLLVHVKVTRIWWDESHDTLMVPILGDVTVQFCRLKVSTYKIFYLQ